MSEDKSHFKIKKGDIEIEYSGETEDVNSRYKEALNWIKTTTTSALPSPKQPISTKHKEPIAKTGRGGHRSPIVSKAVDQLIAEGFLDSAKTPSEVYSELERKVVPGITNLNVSEALKRRARKGVLGRIKGAGEEYNYLKKKTT